MMKILDQVITGLPPLTPPYTGGGEVTLPLREITKPPLPLCKGESEGVVQKRKSIFNFQFSIFNCFVRRSWNTKDNR